MITKYFPLVFSFAFLSCITFATDLLPLGNSLAIDADIDTSQFLPISDIRREDGSPLFLTRGGDHLFNPLIRDDLTEMGHAMVDQLGNKSVRIFSIYRSLGLQKMLKNGRRGTSMYAYTAYPGQSEHHLGTTIDFEFPRTPGQGKAWMRDHAREYGFIQSFPNHCEEYTKIPAEDWHYRWIGKELAALFWSVSASNTTICLQQFLGSLEQYGVFVGGFPEGSAIVQAKRWGIDRADYHIINAFVSHFRDNPASFPVICAEPTNPLITRSCEIMHGSIRLGVVSLPLDTMLLINADNHRVFVLTMMPRYQTIVGEVTPLGWIPSQWRSAPVPPTLSIQQEILPHRVQNFSLSQVAR